MEKPIAAFFCSYIFTLLIVSCDGKKARCGNVILSTPIAYNDFIVDRQNEVIEKMVKLNQLYQQGTNQEIEWHYKELVRCTDSNLIKIKQLTPYEEDSSLKINALNLLNYYSKIFHNDYKEIVDVFLKGVAPSNYEMERIYEIIQEVKKKESELNAQLSKSQSMFAKKFGFEFEEENAIATPDIEKLKEEQEL
jgi:hypothetical protein